MFQNGAHYTDTTDCPLCLSNTSISLNASQSQYVDLGETIVGGNLTAMLWLKVRTSVHNQRLFGFSNAPPNYADNFAFSFTTGGIPVLHFRNGDFVEVLHTTDDPIALNTWTHVALTFADATQQFQLYLNGVLVETSVAATGPLP
eukprot:2062738-Rhodomonas_salina.1